MPWAPSGQERIAGGTLEGLLIIQGLTDTSGQTLGQYLTAFFAQPANANVTTLVTGHSLGGCLATVVAPWISSLLPNYQGTIQPITFAAPTAGNSEFAAYYNTLFPQARRFQNSLDVIPLAYYHSAARVRRSAIPYRSRADEPSTTAGTRSVELRSVRLNNVDRRCRPQAIA